MRLTDHTDYSLRVLMYLNQKKDLVTLNELADQLGISKNNLIKVSNQLAKAGLIDTIRGRTGGLAIAKKTGQISLREIITTTEESMNMAECFSGKSQCTFVHGCRLQKSLTTALEAFLTALGQTTLDDVTPKLTSKSH